METRESQQDVLSWDLRVSFDQRVYVPRERFVIRGIRHIIYRLTAHIRGKEDGTTGTCIIGAILVFWCISHESKLYCYGSMPTDPPA